jgi:hypothetical protein
MHLAASVGTRCVAVFSARDWPGRWHPYGPGHRVLRAAIDCEGCGLVECLDRKNECLHRITVSEVVAACELVLQEKLAQAKAETLVRSEKTCISEGESPSSLEARLPEFETKAKNGKV